MPEGTNEINLQEAKQVFKDMPAVQDGTAIPQKLLKQIAGLDAYGLNIEDEGQGLRIVRVPINDTVSAQVDEIVKPITRLNPDTQQPEQSATSKPTFIIHVDASKQLLPNSEELNSRYSDNELEDLFSTPGFYSVRHYNEVFAEPYTEDKLGKTFEQLVTSVKSVPKPPTVNKDYIFNVLDKAVLASHRAI